MKVSEMEMISPTSVHECLHALTDQQKSSRLIAGGTDAVVRMKDRNWMPDIWINIKGLKELRYIREDASGLHIGPLTTHTDIVKSELLQSKADVLTFAAKEVGATQMQNMGTLGGNLGTASPAGDTIPALYVLDAHIQLSSLHQIRSVPIKDFFIGPGKTVIKPDEMISDIVIRPQEKNEIGIFEKLGPRKAQSISIVNFTASLKIKAQTRQCIGGKLAFGSVAPTIIRAKKCESMLLLDPLDEHMIQNIAKVAWKEVAPISDIRASANYRKDMASALLERGLYRLMKRWENK
ncbi:CO/xanthine dehydrogenase FAD-binding subunit [Geomicrobium halophilum]|uniref:CO/xanthine dehydrogenase FAD-binding subunit n=1 Tax=Geomicrobium halophilum TaxID=549000 RepID=A0A841PPL6_9BACL|nr:FAD binding domain-containing protein [Geomicrobium halophilum]MBB6448231.1 CO/xanthine dehydrogenase FAD-binding subunit [Geomicrobium halophilum]